MKTCVVLLGVGGCVVQAWAQPTETLTYSIEWDFAQISTGSNTGAVYATITPSIGSVTAWNTTPGQGEAGTLMAFASTILDLMSVGGTQPGMLEWSVPSEWTPIGQPGIEDGNGGITGATAGQFAPPLKPNPNTSDKVKLLDLKWTLPGPSGSTYAVGYQTKATTANVYLETASGLPWVTEAAGKVDGEGGFLVTPVPPAVAVMGLVLVAAARRRR